MVGYSTADGVKLLGIVRTFGYIQSPRSSHIRSCRDFCSPTAATYKYSPKSTEGIEIRDSTRGGHGCKGSEKGHAQKDGGQGFSPESVFAHQR